MGDEAIREACAAVQHEIWSHWMKYLFAQCESVEGGWLIPSDKATQQAVINLTVSNKNVIILTCSTSMQDKIWEKH